MSDQSVGVSPEQCETCLEENRERLEKLNQNHTLAKLLLMTALLGKISVNQMEQFTSLLSITSNTLANLRQEHAAELESLRQEHATALERQWQEHDTELESLNDIIKKQGNHIAEYVSQYSELRERHDELQRDHSELRERHDELQRDHSELRERYNKFLRGIYPLARMLRSETFATGGMLVLLLVWLMVFRLADLFLLPSNPVVEWSMATIGWYPILAFLGYSWYQRKKKGKVEERDFFQTVMWMMGGTLYGFVASMAITGFILLRQYTCDFPSAFIGITMGTTVLFGTIAGFYSSGTRWEE